MRTIKPVSCYIDRRPDTVSDVSTQLAMGQPRLLCAHSAVCSGMYNGVYNGVYEGV